MPLSCLWVSVCQSSPVLSLSSNLPLGKMQIVQITTGICESLFLFEICWLSSHSSTPEPVAMFWLLVGRPDTSGREMLKDSNLGHCSVVCQCYLLSRAIAASPPPSAVWLTLCEIITLECDVFSIWPLVTLIDNFKQLWNVWLLADFDSHLSVNTCAAL